MTWFKVDDGFPAHRKVVALPRGPRRLAAIGAWTLAGAWSSANQTEGRLPQSAVDEFAVPRQVQSDLVAAGLWRKVDDGYVMHDFLDYNPSAEKVAEERRASAERQARARERARVAREASRRDGGVTTAVTHASVTRAVTDPVTVDPTRPDPTRPVVPTELPTESATHSLPRGRPSAETRDEPPGFAEWYAAYPRHTARAAAAKAYAKAVRDMSATSVVAREVLLDAARRFAADPTRQQAYTPHPATWLNRGQWDDEGPARPQPASRAEQRHQHNLGVVALFAEREQQQRRELGAS